MQGDAIEQGGFEPESKATPLGSILGRTVHVILETMIVCLKSSGLCELAQGFILWVFVEDDFVPELIIGILVL